MFKWFRNYTRTKTLFMDPHYAAETKNKLALAYAFVAWNLFGFVVYCVYKENVPKTSSNSVDYAKIYGIKDATVVKFAGLKKVDEYDIKLSEEELDEFKGAVINPEERKLYEEKFEERRRAQVAERQLTNT